MNGNDVRWLAKKAARRAVSLVSGPSAAGALRRSQPTIRVLTYHRVQACRRDPFALPPPEFEAQIAAISASGRAIGLDRLLGFLAGTEPSGPVHHRLLVTIDDGYASTLTEAAPILRRHGVPAVAFVTTSRIGTRGDGPERLLDRDEVGALATFGIAVGSHAADHRSLGGSLDNRQLAKQTAGSKDALETMLGHEVAAFAYPFGTKADHSSASRASIQAAGYRAAFTSRHGPVRTSSDPLTLPRIKIESGDPPSVFTGALNGTLDAWRLVDDLLFRFQATVRS